MDSFLLRRAVTTRERTLAYHRCKNEEVCRGTNMRVSLVRASILAAALLALPACTARTATPEIDCDQFQDEQRFTWEINLWPSGAIASATERDQARNP